MKETLTKTDMLVSRIKSIEDKLTEIGETEQSSTVTSMKILELTKQLLDSYRELFSIQTKPLVLSMKQISLLSALKLICKNNEPSNMTLLRFLELIAPEFDYFKLTSQSFGDVIRQ